MLNIDVPPTILVPADEVIEWVGCMLRCMSLKVALSDISLQCNDLSLSGQSKLSRLVYPGEFMSSRPSNTARRKFAVVHRLNRRDVSRLWMRSRIPSAAPPPASVGEPTHSASTGGMLPETQMLFLRWLAAKRSRASLFSRSSCSRVVRA